MSEKTRVLVVEDEEIAREWACGLLDTAGYHTRAVADARSALAAIEALRPHVALIDLRLPDAEDFDLTRRAAAIHCGVIIVSALRDREHRIGGLRAGADDYLTKPCDPEELLLKVRRLAQRIHAVSRALPDDGNGRVSWAYDPDERVWRHADGRTLVLSQRETRLLRTLCDRPGRVFSRDQLKQAVFGEPGSVADRSVDSLVGNRWETGDMGNRGNRRETGGNRAGETGDGETGDRP